MKEADLKIIASLGATIWENDVLIKKVFSETYGKVLEEKVSEFLEYKKQLEDQIKNCGLKLQKSPERNLRSIRNPMKYLLEKVHRFKIDALTDDECNDTIVTPQIVRHLKKIQNNIPKKSLNNTTTEVNTTSTSNEQLIANPQLHAKKKVFASKIARLKILAKFQHNSTLKSPLTSKPKIVERTQMVNFVAECNNNNDNRKFINRVQTPKHQSFNFSTNIDKNFRKQLVFDTSEDISRTLNTASSATSEDNAKVESPLSLDANIKDHANQIKEADLLLLSDDNTNNDLYAKVPSAAVNSSINCKPFSCEVPALKMLPIIFSNHNNIAPTVEQSCSLMSLSQDVKYFSACSNTSEVQCATEIIFCNAVAGKSFEEGKYNKSFKKSEPDKSFEEDKSNKSFEGKPDKSFEEDKSNKSFEEDKSNKSFDKDKSNKSFEGKPDKSFEEDKSNKSFEEDKSNKSFEEGKPDKSFEEDKSNKSFEEDKSNKSFEKDKSNKSFEEDKSNMSFEGKPDKSLVNCEEITKKTQSLLINCDESSLFEKSVSSSKMKFPSMLHEIDVLRVQNLNYSGNNFATENQLETDSFLCLQLKELQCAGDGDIECKETSQIVSTVSPTYVAEKSLSQERTFVKVPASSFANFNNTPSFLNNTKATPTVEDTLQISLNQRIVDALYTPSAANLMNFKTKKQLASTLSNYVVDDLDSGDETDVAENPRKEVPMWAQDVEVRLSIRRQRQDLDSESVERYFGQMTKPSMNEIFASYPNHQRYNIIDDEKDAEWESPLTDPRVGKCRYKKKRFGTKKM